MPTIGQSASLDTRLQSVKQYYESWDINDNYPGAVRTRNIAEMAEKLSNAPNRISALYDIVLNVAYFLVVLASVRKHHQPTVSLDFNKLTLHDLWVPINEAVTFHDKYWNKWRITRYLKRKKYAKRVEDLRQKIENKFKQFGWPISLTDFSTRDQDLSLSLSISEAVQWARGREEYLRNEPKSQTNGNASSSALQLRAPIPKLDTSSASTSERRIASKCQEGLTQEY